MEEQLTKQIRNLESKQDLWGNGLGSACCSVFLSIVCLMPYAITHNLWHLFSYAILFIWLIISCRLDKRYDKQIKQLEIKRGYRLWGGQKDYLDSEGKVIKIVKSRVVFDDEK